MESVVCVKMSLRTAGIVSSSFFSSDFSFFFFIFLFFSFLSFSSSLLSTFVFSSTSSSSLSSFDVFDILEEHEEDVKKYYIKRFEQVKESHELTQSLKVKIDLTEGQLGTDKDFDMYIKEAVVNKMLTVWKV